MIDDEVMLDNINKQVKILEGVNNDFFKNNKEILTGSDPGDFKLDKEVIDTFKEIYNGQYLDKMISALNSLKFFYERKQKGAIK